MECESMLFVKNHIPYLWDLSNSFSNSFIDFYSCEGFHQVIYQEEWSIKLRVENGGWQKVCLLHVSRCEMLHFVMSYMKQNKSRKQTLESAQYGLEISFKSSGWLVLKTWDFYFYPENVTALSKLCPERLPAMSWIRLRLQETRFSKLQVDIHMRHVWSKTRKFQWLIPYQKLRSV